MTHDSILRIYGTLFPHYYKNDIDSWFPNGKNSIRIRFKNGQELIFTYTGEDYWRLETVPIFLSKNFNLPLEGGIEMND